MTTSVEQIAERQAARAGDAEQVQQRIREAVQGRVRRSYLHLAACLLSDKHVSRGAQRTLQALVVWCRGGRQGHPSNAQLGADSNQSERTVQRHTRELVRAGLVELVQRGGGRVGKRAGKANVYRITELGWEYLGIDAVDVEKPRRRRRTKPRQNGDTLVSCLSDSSSPLPPASGGESGPAGRSPECAVPLVPQDVVRATAAMTTGTDVPSTGAAAPSTPLGAGTADRPANPSNPRRRGVPMQISGQSVDIAALRETLKKRGIPDESAEHACNVVREQPRISNLERYAVSVAQGHQRRREAADAYERERAARAAQREAQERARRAAAPPVAARCDDEAEQRAHALRLAELERAGTPLKFAERAALQAARALGWIGTPCATTEGSA